MRSRQDQLHAYQYSMQRVVAALVTHDPDPARSPLNRTGSIALAGLLVALIALGGTWAYSAITGRSGAREIRDETAVFVEKETGARYVYIKADDRLHPVVNYTSGLLLAKSDKANPVVIRRSGLAKLQRKAKLQLGATLGIPDAPESPPPPAELIREPWRLCTQPGTGTSSQPQSLLMIGGQSVRKGHTLAVPGPGKAAEALHVADPAGRQYLIYGHRKFLIRKPETAGVAFGWGSRQPTPVAEAWINAIPAGTDLQPLRIAGLGDRSSVLGKKIGQLYRTPGPNNTHLWAVLQRNGVLPITEVQARLLDVETNIGDAITLGSAEFVALPTAGVDPAPAEQNLLPSTVPHFVTVALTICATVTDASTGVSALLVDPEVSADQVSPVAATAAGTATPQAPTASRITVPFGRGVLVEPAASPDAPVGSNIPTLVTDAGLRYPIADRDALTKLGYGHTTAVRMPAELVALLPPGPVLGTQEALRPRP